jgi:probable O-glycosylation ligase (exosortase A-associated)
MRDIFITLTILGTIPIILIRPHIGMLVWCWIAYMNPHRLTWGFAYDFQFALFIGIVTMLAWFLSREPKGLPLNGVTILLIILSFWVSLTTLFAVVPDAAHQKWDTSIKILLMTFFTIILMRSRERLHALIWVIVLSVGFYGAKGGLFTLLGVGQGEGEARVYGPMGTFLADNNALALTLIMILPLMRYLQMQSEIWWMRWGLAATMLVTVVAIIGTYSRGAVVAGVAMLFMLFWKSRKKFLIAVAAVVALGFSFAMAPEEWIERMETIQNYEQDESAQGRIEAWTFAYRLALDRPVLGGGFLVNEDRELFFQYVPDAAKERAFHSVYFEVLGEHGFVALGLFLVLLGVSYRIGGWLKRHTRGRPELNWARDLGAMGQVSLVGYAAGGLFQSLAFFDLFYHVVAIMLLAKLIVQREIQTKPVIAAQRLDHTGMPAPSPSINR